MKEYKIDRIRNFALIGHGSSGKTSLVEAMLYSAGVTSRLGRVGDGTTMSDFQEDEIERKFSIGSSLLNCEWDNCKFNIVDTPGYADFIADAKPPLRVVDLAVVVINGVSGLEVGTEQVWEFAEQENLPRLIVINMFDKEHTKFDEIMATAQERFGKHLTPIQFPVNPGPGFNQIADLLLKKVLTFSNDGTGKMSSEEPSGDIQARIEELHEQLIEKVAESDDELLEKFFDQGTLTEEELKTGLAKAIAEKTVVPVLVTSAYNNIGVRRLMDFIARYAPTPLTRGEVHGFDAEGNEITRKISPDEPLSLFVFKTLSESHLGEVSLFRVFSGSLKSGMEVKNLNRNSSEKIGQMFFVNGKERKEIGVINVGDMGAVVKLKNTHTGDTLSDPKAPIKFPDLEFPEPVIQVAIEPKSRGDEEKISGGLSSLNAEDPTFTVAYDPELKQTILSGQGELHLAIVINRLKKRYGVDVTQKPPRIPYRETITTEGHSKFRHKKQTGGAGQFAEVWMRIEPLPRGSGVEFTEELVGQNVDRVFVPSVEKGVRAACEEGILAGYKVVDLKAIFYDGKQHPVDSKDIAFQIAGKGAFRECFLSAKPILLEPIYDVEIKVPEEFMGDVMGDISTRRGKIQGMDSEGPFQIIRAKVPLAELYRYSTALRSMTQGRGVHRQKFSHYEPVPHDIQQKIIEEYQKSREG